VVVGRRHHTTAVIHFDNTHKRLIHFGGLPATRREGDALAATSIVEISEYSCEVFCVLAQITVHYLPILYYAFE